MPLFGKGDEAENRFKEAEKYIQTSDENFSFDRAIHLLEEAAMLKPHEPKYRKRLEAVKERKAKSHEKFLMQVEEVFERKRHAEAVGRVQQGVIHNGDKVRIARPGTEKTDTVVSLKFFHASRTFAIAGDGVGLVLDNLSTADIERGDVIERVDELTRLRTKEELREEAREKAVETMKRRYGQDSERKKK